MTRYKVYRIDKAGRIDGPGVEFEAGSDVEALVSAREKIAGSELEVRQEKRLVGRIDEVPPIERDAPPKRG
jgi:hypothetical protein